MTFELTSLAKPGGVRMSYISSQHGDPEVRATA